MARGLVHVQVKVVLTPTPQWVPHTPHTPANSGGCLTRRDPASHQASTAGPRPGVTGGALEKVLLPVLVSVKIREKYC